MKTIKDYFKKIIKKINKLKKNKLIKGLSFDI